VNGNALSAANLGERFCSKVKLKSIHVKRGRAVDVYGPPDKRLLAGNGVRNRSPSRRSFPSVSGVQLLGRPWKAHRHEPVSFLQVAATCIPDSRSRAPRATSTILPT